MKKVYACFKKDHKDIAKEMHEEIFKDSELFEKLYAEWSPEVLAIINNADPCDEFGNLNQYDYILVANLVGR